MKTRLAIQVRGTPVAFYVAPHQKKSGWVVVKSQHPEVGAMLAQSLKLQAGRSWRGGRNFITEFEAADFAAGLGDFVTMTVVALGQTKELAPPTPKQIAAPKCPECGTDDGTHFNYCGQNLH